MGTMGCLAKVPFGLPPTPLDSVSIFSCNVCCITVAVHVGGGMAAEQPPSALLVGVGPIPIVATPRVIPPREGGYGWQFFQRHKFGSECEAAPPATR